MKPRHYHAKHTAKNTAYAHKVARGFSISQPLVNMLPMIERQMLLALRLAVVASKQDYDALEVLRIRLGCAERAVQFRRLMIVIGRVWEGSFHCNRPCCNMVNSDEAVVLSMLRAAFTGDRGFFDEDVKTMFSPPQRSHLWRTLCLVCDAMLHKRL